VVAEGSIRCTLDIDGRATTAGAFVHHERRPTLDVGDPKW
jgi:hypothetical protein